MLSDAATIWNTSDTPNQDAVTDGSPLEIGVKFRADADGSITALRFYKGSANTGTHVGNLWNSAGTLLASATFSGETASGWQEVMLSAPVAIQAGTTYVASYHSSSGYFALDPGYFTADVYNPPLRALATGVDGGNGVYKYGASGFPTETWGGNNYWVDVVFTTTGDITPPTVTSFTIPTTATSLTVPITDFAAADNVEVTGYLITESSAAPSPTAGGWATTPQTAYTFATAGSKTLYAWAKDAAGNVSAGSSASVAITLNSIWNSGTVPTQAAVSDGSPIEIGVKFRADVEGFITALRFYKGAANTGTHIGHLWTGTGTLLATATFTEETASGWQAAQLSAPVAIQAGTTYIASYHSSSGYFAINESYFTVDVYNPPLRALATGVDGGNGVYKYGTSGFPTETWNGNNYWVDVVFSPNASGDTASPFVTSFIIPTTTTTLTVPITSFTATDNFGVTGYLVTESSAVPSPTDGGWAATAPTAYTFATGGSKTLYAWTKDAAGNVSTSLSASVTITLTDSIPPTVTAFTVPATASSLTVSITGFTATDNVGVTGYLVTEFSAAPASTDGGWTATAPTVYTCATGGSKTLYAWAKDAAGNVSNSMSAPVTITVDQQLYSIWNGGTVPSQAAVSDGTPIEIGVKFQADVDGSITALRFYKGAANTGTHIGHLWTRTGTLMASVTFTGETASGWQEVQLSSPVAIQAGTTYVASYHSSSGYFAMNEGYFTADVYNPPLRALATGVDGGNGVYKEGSSGFPTQTWNGNNYWVDVVFATSTGPSTQPTVTSFTVPVTATSLTVPITSFTATDDVGVTGYLVSESSATPSPTAAGWSTTAQTSYTFATAGSKTLYAWAKDAAGNVSASRSAAVTITLDGQLYTIWNSGTVPSQAAVSDGIPIEIGVKFRADVNGSITALRFYKGTANTGTHVGHLWTRTGTLLASATFSGETTSGWQEVQLSAPVAIEAGTTYIASYHSSSGYFAMNEGYFTADVYNPPLRALATGVDGGNGVYKEGTSGFPTQTWNGNNYWVDVVFNPGESDTASPTVTSFTVPATSSSLVVPITAFTATDNVGVTGYLLTETSAEPLPTAGGWTATAPTSYTFATGGSKTLYAWAKDAAGNISTSLSAFVTVTVEQQLYSIWNDGTVPSQPAVSDGTPIELGVKFQADVVGSITALRFYKGAANTGTHVGNLWTRTGTHLASATFTGESPSGWQEVQLPTPVAIQAGTTYVASYHSSSGYFAIDEAYFTTDVYTPPLRALARGVDGGNGVYKVGESGFPTATWNANNYWVDVVFSPGESETIPPTVTSFSVPATSSSLVVPITGFTATDNVGVTGYLVNESSTTPSPTAVGWSATAQTAYAFATGGSKTLYAWAKDAAGNVSAAASDSVAITLADTSTPTVTAFSVPATASSLTVPITNFSATDNIGVTGYLVNESSTVPSPISSGWSATAQTSYTFATTGSKTLYAWAKDAAGHVSAARSATVTISSSDPIPPVVTSFTVPGTATSLIVSITSFTATDNVGVTGYLVNEASTTPSPIANGWSATAQTSYTFTSGDSKTLYAWAKDAVGNVSASMSASVNITLTDPNPPVVTTVLPPGNALSVSTGTTLSVVFSEAMAAATVNETTFELRTSSNSPVPAVVTYDSATNTATLTPSNQLAVSTSYTAVVKGGSTGVKDAGGNPLAADYTWTFASSASTPFDNGPGGPILVITSAANPFSRYLTEILAAEGLNAYAVQDISSVTATLLAQHEVAILGNITITSTQATMFSNWVNAGGNLIAMRPDKNLAGLLGLVDTATTLDEGYLLINTSSGPGVGIVGQTMQYHGTADRYTLLGDTASLATLYSDATTATANPAVTLRSIGSNGGQAAAFTFDLSRSVVYTRQGNPAWVDQDRDGLFPTRANDLFYGAAAGDLQPDWVDLTKVAIPQADEQQRLLANLIIRMNADKKPLPRFWYFPHQYEAVLIMTGDDHDGLYGSYGTEGRFAYELANSTAGCSVEDWECIRSSSYLISDYPAGLITDGEAVAYNAQGFEIGIHVNTNCQAYTEGMLATFFREQTMELRTLFPSIPPPVSHRQHCIAWSGYTILPEEEVKHGIRLDTNYYYWPAAWAVSPGFFTGSGMPMRFTDDNGVLIDVYQAVTQLTDESGQTYPYTLDTLLDRAIGPEKYYGAFTANMHTDYEISNDYNAMISSAQARGVPIISAKQMLKWLDGRNGSKFGGLTWTSNVLGFTITQGQGAIGLQAMVPIPSGLGITGFTRNGSSVSYNVKTIKGVSYAIFSGLTGTYSVTMAANP